MGLLLKIILVFVGVYLIGKAIVRGILSYFFGYTEKNLNDQARQRQEEFARKKKKMEGNVTINYQPKSDKNFGRNEGDYIDFEEVK